MSVLIECIPNLSQGRDQMALDRLWLSLQRVPELKCLHRHIDPDHNRSVLTLAGPPAAIRKAAQWIFHWSRQHIDMRQHQGVHPRIGAVDVFPLVPLQNIGMAECVDFSRQLASELAETFELPIYLYEQSALKAHRRALPEIRKGQYEGLPSKMRDPAWLPDFGPPQPHPEMGATVLGVRPLLIAWNVLLHSQDLALAQQIARQIRERDGGFKALRALGLYLPHRMQTQVSMNLLDYQQTSIATIYQRIQQLAAAAGVSLAETEFIGLVPAEALEVSALQWLQTSDIPSERVLERKLLIK